jgi:hypothetical protein
MNDVVRQEEHMRMSCPRHHARQLILLILIAAGMTGAGGCVGRPNQANILLRKQKQELEEKIAGLEREKARDAALIRALQDDRPSVPTLPSQRLSELFTTRAIEFGRLTGGIDLDRTKAGDEGVKVYVVPADQDGQPLKAAGSFVIRAFDLSEPRTQLIGTWEFDVEAAKKNWYGSILNYTYAFALPWQQVPRHEELTLKVTFTEALTGRSFNAQTVAKIKLPDPRNPTTVPAAGPDSRPG